MNTVVQCDFDGTVTEEDTSFFLLDAFAQGDWRHWLRQYREHRISVGQFNSRAFAMVKVDESTLLQALKGRVKVRAGFEELVNYCRERGIRFVIVSNGLEFCIKAVLKDLGLERIEVHAARATFSPDGMKVYYLGPDGGRLDDDVKQAYTRSFLGQGYRVVYVGNGDSDIAPAKCAHHVFATGELLAHFRENNLGCQPFENFIDVVRGLEHMSQS